MSDLWKGGGERLTRTLIRPPALSGILGLNVSVLLKPSVTARHEGLILSHAFCLQQYVLWAVTQIERADWKCL